ncbi:MAG: O-antigen ligase family protein [Terriglobales bacterium]|jgi:O-antigen ligase
MNELKPWQWAAFSLGLVVALFLLYNHLQYFGSVSFLGGILLIELIIASLWKYDQRFFTLLMIAFVWAGMNLPMQGAWTGGRWVVLTAGALIGYLIWMKTPRSGFKSIHLIGAFCVGAAFVSATVSPFPGMASSKALSLFILFLYCASGARLAVLGREERFFSGLTLASEIVVYVTALCYLGIGEQIWGNPNSLGAAMSIGIFPILLWRWLTTSERVKRLRRLFALLLCVYLIVFSMARAGMAAMVLVTIVFCLSLHQYRLLLKVAGLALLLIAVTGMLSPDKLSKSMHELSDAVLYKGHKDEGILGSRLSPWEKSITTIKEHPWFGTGYGTSPTGQDPGLAFGRFASSAETSREHGSSYMTIAEWVGLLGVVPFVLLLGLTFANVWRVFRWMIRTSDPCHYSIPLAMVIFAGFVHAGFEDWLFAVGSYPCVYFWSFAFLLADLVPPALAVPDSRVFFRIPSPAGFGAVVPNR